ncbi:TraB/GumN family protein [Lysobacter niastensis]|uniref:TraB/GumN family protein n=1 Tax=Lysobacter niastensis TaxID=380629 RepID=A0ABS0B2R8_9GAMM|nr:TraB/GumN family protein [Lysobacter niastensis]MBF6022779.1 TraB/GumN family protein [Lysobacter niastensis]
MRRLLLVSCLALLSISRALAQAAAPPPEGEIRDLAPIVVSGVQPGPGMWKVSKGDHAMWVLGTISPVPKRMEWEARDVEAVIARAQEFIEAPGVRVDAKAGFFQRLALVPKALGARKNPDGLTLEQVVPADMYARWLPLKRKYMGNDAGIEQWRPMFAAMELYQEAIDDSGLKQGGLVAPVVDRAVKKYKVNRTSPTLMIMIEDPKQALLEFRESQLDDLDCFGKTLQRLETDLDTMRDRANAWATGDLDTLRALPYSDQNEACLRAAARAGVLRKRAGDIEAQVESRWMEAAEKALANNAVTFAVLPMRELLKPDGYIAKLQSKGYVVEAP